MKKLLTTLILITSVMFQFRSVAQSAGTYSCTYNNSTGTCNDSSNNCSPGYYPGFCDVFNNQPAACGDPTRDWSCYACPSSANPTPTIHPGRASYCPAPPPTIPLGQYACVAGSTPGTCTAVGNCISPQVPGSCVYLAGFGCIRSNPSGTNNCVNPPPSITPTPTLSQNKYKCLVDPGSTTGCILNSTCISGYTAGSCNRSGSSCTPSSETSCQAITPPPLTGSPIPSATPGRPADRGIGLGCAVNGGFSADSCGIAAAFGNNCIPGTTPVPLPDKNGICTARTSCVCECEGAPGTVPTALGCVPYKLDGNVTIVHWILDIIAGIVTGISLLLGIVGGLKYVMSSGNPEGIEEAKGVITAAISGLLLTLFSVLILRVIGIEILGLPQFSPSGGDLKIE